LLAAEKLIVANAVTAIQNNLRATFHDPSFTVPGATPEAQL
jgi:hypothetical protein